MDVEYAFLEVQKTSAPVVTLVGPHELIKEIYPNLQESLRQGYNSHLVVCTLSTLGNSMEIRLAGFKGVDNSTLMKSSLLDEVLKRGYRLTPRTDVKSNSITLQRNRDIYGF